MVYDPNFKNALVSSARRLPGRSTVLGASIAVLASLSAVIAQDSAAPPEAPVPNPPDITPFIFAPDIFSVPAPAEIQQGVNTPSGLSPFTASRELARGFILTASQAFRFDDNARRLASGVLPPPGTSKSDSYSVSSFGASFARDIGLQTVFVRAEYGLTRYRRNTDLDNSRYLVSSGINWQFGSTCKGNLVFSANQAEVPYQDVAVGSTTSLSKTEAADFTGRCHVFSNVYATFGTGHSNSSFSSTPTNDSRRKSIRTGLEYAVPGLHTLGIEAVYSVTDFTNRISTVQNPLTTELTQREYRSYYNYIVSPKTVINLSGGIFQSEVSSGFSSSTQNKPVGSASFNWRPTPKLLFSVGGQILYLPPQTIQSDYQRANILSFSALYSYSEKLNFSAVYNLSRQTQSTFAGQSGIVTSGVTRSNTFALDANYQATPFWIAGLGYRFSERTDNLTGQKVNSNLYTMSLSYRR